MPAVAIVEIPYDRRPYGQGVFSYAARNVRPVEDIHAQAAPDPVRYGDTPCRASRMPIAVMTDPRTFGYWGLDDFIPYAKNLTKRFANARLPVGEGVNAVSQRVNIYREPASTYGSLFTLLPQSYGYA